jgi:hypothetical protein
MVRPMSRLHVALQDGFAHDSVRVCIGGAEVYSATDVHSPRYTGIADKFDAEVEDGTVRLDVMLPNRSPPNQIVELFVSEEAWVAICLDEEGQLRHWMSLTPFVGT